MELYGTIGPSVMDEEIIYNMIINGMTGLRLNLSHQSLNEAENIIKCIRKAETKANKNIKLLIDLQGSELRIGKINDIILNTDDVIDLDCNILNINDIIIKNIFIDDIILFDDAKIKVRVLEKKNNNLKVRVLRGGVLKSNKSIKIENKDIELPLFTKSDLDNIKLISKYNVYGIMQPFVRNKNDVTSLKNILKSNNLNNIKIFSKIENVDGFNNVEEIIDETDEVIIARGDLGSSFPLHLIGTIQKEIEKKCVQKNKPFMVVTELLKTMEFSPIPSRAEVLDIFNAILDGASSLMVTNETAIGKYPIEVIKYLKKISDSAIDYLKEQKNE